MRIMQAFDYGMLGLQKRDKLLSGRMGTVIEPPPPTGA